MVGASQRGVGKSCTCAYDENRDVVVGDVIADLFQAARGVERRDGIGNRSQAAHRHSGCHAGHIRFRDAAVEKSGRALGFEAVEETVSDIAGQHYDPGIGRGK